jgi:acyl-CoA synthetase (AMP-forming)/AMP-acid ligase II
MKNVILIVLIIVSCSCYEQDKTIELPLEKIYMVEYKFSLNNYQPAFCVVGFCELDKKFNLHIYHSSSVFYGYSNGEITDSLKNKISNVVGKYPVDTTFLYTGDLRIYDGNSYIFIFEKSDSVKTKIYFEPKYLPEDLLFLYQCIYTDRQKIEKECNYEILFKEFENIILSNKNLPPPPILEETIQFMPPPNPT